MRAAAEGNQRAGDGLSLTAANFVNKESELFYLEKFKENFPEFPEGIVCLNEKPDFLIKTNSNFLGIEITGHYRERSPNTKSPLQQKLNTRRKIIDLAKSIYDGKKLPPLFLHVHFNLNYYCSESKIQSVADMIAQLAEQSISLPSSEIAWKADEIPSRGIDLITVKKRNTGINYWSAPFGSFVPPINPQQIQDILNDKSARQMEYRKRCDLTWLVIVMNRFDPASFSLIPETTLEHLYTHSFDSAFLFFYDYAHSQKPPFLLRTS